MTALDQAHAAMSATPEDDAARLGFYEHMAACELFLLLEAEPEEDRVTPRVFETSDGPIALAFDLPERLTGFTGATEAYAAMSGRALARMLGEAGIGLALNPEVAPSSIVMPSEALVWLTETLGDPIERGEGRPVELKAPGDMPERFLTALDRRLATAVGLARMAYLARVTYDSGTTTHLLAFIGAMPAAEPALAQACREALIFSGLEPGAIDVAFFAPSDPLAARLAKVGLRFDLPRFEARPAPEAQGSDPSKPPRLR